MDIFRKCYEWKEADDIRAAMDRAMDIRFAFARATNADDVHFTVFRNTVRLAAKPTNSVCFG